LATPTNPLSTNSSTGSHGLPVLLLLLLCLTQFYSSVLYLPRDALVYSTVLRLHVVRPPVRPSVCL